MEALLYEKETGFCQVDFCPFYLVFSLYSKTVGRESLCLALQEASYQAELQQISHNALQFD
jgi:hypothetical protein